VVGWQELNPARGRPLGGLAMRVGGGGLFCHGLRLGGSGRVARSKLLGRLERLVGTHALGRQHIITWRKLGFAARPCCRMASPASQPGPARPVAVAGSSHETRL